MKEKRLIRTLLVALEQEYPALEGAVRAALERYHCIFGVENN
jgi:hypothetical protein